MSAHDVDRLDGLLAALPASAADEARDARVRVRCHAVLAARRTAAARARTRAGRWKRIVAPILVGGLSVVYFTAMVWRLFD